MPSASMDIPNPESRHVISAVEDRQLKELLFKLFPETRITALDILLCSEWSGNRALVTNAINVGQQHRKYSCIPVVLH
jgi:hypothetical protein